ALVLYAFKMALHPVPLDLVRRCGSLKSLPQVGILDRLAIGGPPPVLLPVMQPFGNATAQILRIGVDLDRARALQGGESLDGGRQFHSVVGRGGFPAFEFLYRPVMDEQSAPAARPGIARTGSIRPYRHACTHGPKP